MIIIAYNPVSIDNNSVAKRKNERNWQKNFLETSKIIFDETWKVQ